VRTEKLNADRPEDVARAAQLLREGKVVAFPTETVYGLGARADDPQALAELRRVKARQEDRPFALLIAHPQQMDEYAAPDRRARALARQFWPGALTLVVSDGKGGDVGLRCPDSPIALELLRVAGAPVAASSANVGGQPPATTAGEVLRSFDGAIAAVLDAGAARLGVASTVVRLTGDQVEVLREGAIPRERILEVAGLPR